MEYSRRKPMRKWELCSNLGALDSPFLRHWDWPFNMAARGTENVQVRACSVSARKPARAFKSREGAPPFLVLDSLHPARLTGRTNEAMQIPKPLIHLLWVQTCWEEKRRCVVPNRLFSALQLTDSTFYFISTSALLVILYIIECIFTHQTPPQFLLELEQVRTYVASSLIAVYFFCICMCGFFFFITLSLTLGGRPMIGTMGEETAVSQWVSLLCSWMTMSNVFFIHFTHVVFLFSQIHCLLFFYSVNITQDYI